MNNQALLYLRVSTERQGAEGYSLETQELGARNYCQQRGLAVAGAIIDEQSGGDWFREGLDKLRECVQRGAKHIVVYDSDRLARDFALSVSLLDEMEKQGVQVHDVLKGRPLWGSDDAKFVDVIEFMLAEKEKKKIRERTIRGRLGKAGRGEYLGNGSAPYGYDKVGTKGNHRLVLNQEEAQIIEKIFTWYVVDGVGATEIARRLTNAHTPTPWDKRGLTLARQLEVAEQRADSGKKPRKAMRKYGEHQWNVSSLYNILRNPVYTGTTYANRYKTETKEGRRVLFEERPRSEWLGSKVDPIIPQQLFDAAQLKLATGREKSRRNRGVNQYLVAGRIRCACGYSCPGKPLKGRYLYYQCSRNRELRNRDGGGRCGLPYVRVDILDGLVWEWITDTLLDEQHLQAELDRQRNEGAAERAKLHEQIDGLSARLAHVNAQLEKLLDLYLAGSWDMEMLSARKVQLEAERDSYQTAVRALQERAAQQISQQDVQTILELAAELRAKAAAADYETRRQLIELLGVEVTLHHLGQKNVSAKATSIISTADLAIVSNSS